MTITSIIQRYSDLKIISNHLNYQLAQKGHIQKIYSTAELLCFQLRLPGKTLWFYLGRGLNMQGIWWHHLGPIASLRKQDLLLAYARKHLSSCLLQKISIDTDDRIIALEYFKWGRINYFLYFWKGKESYFLHYYHEDEKCFLLKSWQGKTSEVTNPDYNLEQLFDMFQEVGRKKLAVQVDGQSTSDVLRKVDQDMDQYELQKTATLNPQELPKAQIKKNNKKSKDIQQDIDKLNSWKQIQDFLYSNPSMIPATISFGPVQIAIPKNLTTLDQRKNFLFEKLKKWRSLVSMMEQRLALVKATTTVQNPAIKKSKNNPLSVDTTLVTKPIWNNSDAKNKNKNKNKSAHESKNATHSHHVHDQFVVYDFLLKDHAHGDYLISGKIGVGLSASGNDFLRNRWAHQQDIWLHLDQQTSAHAILKLTNNINNLNITSNLNSIPPELLQLVGSILMHHQARNNKSPYQQATIVYTQVKNLKAVKGAAGLVRYAKEKRFLAIFNSNWESLITNN